MPRPPDPHLHERLIAAATLEFAESGYTGATLDGIAARAGVTKGGVYFHFDGKEELFFAVLDHWRERRRRLLQVPVPGPAGAAAALRGFLASYLRFHFREPAATHLLRILGTELRGRFTARLREDDRQEQRWLRGSLRDLLVSGASDGSLVPDDPALSAFVLAAAVRGALEQWFTAPADVEGHCHEEALAQALVARYATGRPGEAARGARSEYDFRERPDT
ncbi:MAG: TetR/AcrR family transcriptional regulator [Planctomycetes bacterium]|nr:TetR/AcrR family transcriptional regulator [Planctomycetota bacterium]